MTHRRYLEVRYIGQSHELSIPVAEGAGADGRLHAALATFHQEHERAYGFASPNEPVEVGEHPRYRRRPDAGPVPRQVASGAPADAARKCTRQVYFGDPTGAGSGAAVGFVACPIYDRYQLAGGATLDGPAIVEELDSTTVVLPGLQRLDGPIREPAAWREGRLRCQTSRT